MFVVVFQQVCTDLGPLLCCLGHMFWVIVMLEDPSTTHFQCSHWGKEVVAQNVSIHGPIHPPLDTVKSSCPLSWETPPKQRIPPPCFTVGMVFLGLYSRLFLFLQTRRVELMPNSSILVSSDHITFSQASSRSSRCSLANFRRACTCAFFRRGTLCAQQDFNPSLCSVLLMVLFMTVVPTAFRSLTSSTGLIPDLSHHHWYLTRRDLAWSPRPREIGGDFVFLPFSNNCSNSC